MRIPLSCYTVHHQNQFLYLSESPDDSSVQPRVLTLTQQACSGPELAAEIQKQLNSGGPFVQNRGAGYSLHLQSRGCDHPEAALQPSPGDHRGQPEPLHPGVGQGKPQQCEAKASSSRPGATAPRCCSKSSSPS